MAISDKQIKALMSEAVEAGDDAQVCICSVALDEPVGGYMELLNRRTRARIIEMSRDEARAECERVIREAAAQEVV